MEAITGNLTETLQRFNDYINGDDGIRNSCYKISKLHNRMNTLGEKWGVSFLTGLVRSVYAVAKMATRIALAALCFVCAITLGCFGIVTNSEKTHCKKRAFARKTRYNLDEFKDGGKQLCRGVAETFQLCAIAVSIHYARMAKNNVEMTEEGPNKWWRWSCVGGLIVRPKSCSV